MSNDLERLKLITIGKLMDDPDKLLNKQLIIGFDVSETKDHCSLIVGIKRGEKEFMVVNEFYDDEADKIYKMLMGDKNDNN